MPAPAVLFRSSDRTDISSVMVIRLTFSRGPETVCLAVIRTASEMCLLLKHQTHEHLRMATAPNLIDAVLHQQDQERDLVASGWSLSGVQGLSPGGLVTA
jgi:hypothetical protein